MLTKAGSIMKKVIKGRPTVQYYLQRYRGDVIWQKDDIYTNNFDVKHITCFQKEHHRHYMNATAARNRFLKESEYLSMRLNPAYASLQERLVAKNFMRHVGVLKKQQLKLMSNFDKSVINNIDLSL